MERGRPNRAAQVRYAPAAADRIERLLGMGLGMDSTKASDAEAASLRSVVRIIRQYVAGSDAWNGALFELFFRVPVVTRVYEEATKGSLR